MKPNLISAVLTAGCVLAMPVSGNAEEIKMGVIVGFTGPGESLAPGMAESAELAWNEINTSGRLLDGATLVSVRADSTCIDAAAATAAAERLVTTDQVSAIMGADCSGVTTAILNTVAIPNGITMISPSATSPALTQASDEGLFFRTAPSDARQGDVLRDVLLARGIKSVALTYTNNDYGKGFADAFKSAYKAAGGQVTLDAPHEDGRGDYSAEVAALAAAGGEVLVVIGYADQGGLNMIRAAIDAGAFETFALGDGMYAQSVIDAIGADLNGSFGTLPWSQGEGSAAFERVSAAAGVSSDGTYRREAYDAAALLALAIEAAGSTDRVGIAEHVLDVANAPGEPILPGELGKALNILKAGGDIDYVGATNVELIGPGEASGTYREYVITDGSFETVTFR